ncbi:MAG: S4 domain-containing protein [Flavobacteriales bacterium]
MRLDKFLWCVRLFPTRSGATEACRKGHVQLNGREIKPAAQVSVGQAFSVKRPPIWRSYEVIQLTANRVGAKLVPGLIRETTSFTDLEKLELADRTRSEHLGEGRPTKRDRRELDKFSGT